MRFVFATQQGVASVCRILLKPAAIASAACSVEREVAFASGAEARDEYIHINLLPMSAAAAGLDFGARIRGSVRA
jgi:hypothetical protein